MAMARAGVDEEFERFYAQDFPRLVAALTRRFGDAELARDAVADAVGRAFERMADGAEFDCLAAWVRTVATNVARDRLRSRAMQDRHTHRLVTQQALTLPVADVEADLDLGNVFASLSPRNREVATLRYVHDLTHDEIGELLGI